MILTNASLARLLLWPCTVITVTEGERDERGESTESTSSATAKAWWHPTIATETVGDIDWQDDTLTIYLGRCGTTITGRSRVAIPSGAYEGLWEVAGPPRHWKHESIEFTEARIRRVT